MTAADEKSLGAIDSKTLLYELEEFAMKIKSSTPTYSRRRGPQEVPENIVMCTIANWC